CARHDYDVPFAYW
nr:immunoglobulin heavy chain junction region [Mus musculus]